MRAHIDRVLRRTSVAALATALVPLAARAQEGVSSSQNYVATAQAVMTAGGTSASASFTAHQGVGQLTTGYVASSAGFATHGGVVFSASSAPPPPPGAPPVVAQLVPPDGFFSTGQQVLVVGSNFAAVGAGLPIVTFDGVPGLGVTVVDDTKLLVQVPVPGIDLTTSNPKGPVDVEVIDNHGSDILEAGYTFHPSCKLNPVSPSIGKPAQVEAKTGTGGGVLGHVAGGPALGSGIPIAGFTGSLTLLPQFTVIPWAAPTAGTLVQDFVITDPSLIGVPLEIQFVCVLTVVPLAGGFSNRVSFQFQP